MSWYMFFQLLPGVSERSLSWLIPRLWAAWSRGYDAASDVADVLAALSGPGRATAALRYYRALFLPWMRSATYAAEQRRLFAGVRQPVLYLHGETDGCIHPALARRGARFLPAGSEFELVPGCGHFLQLERPDFVGDRIAGFVGPTG
jgi:pimeloyl-ACP methyl ester carboxylesterase